MAEGSSTAYVIKHIVTNHKHILLVLGDYISVNIDCIEYRSFISIDNIHIYPEANTEEHHYLLFKSLLNNATVQKNEQIGHILVIGYGAYAMFLQLFTMEEIGVILEKQSQQ